jgi:hypothetical protein
MLFFTQKPETTKSVYPKQIFIAYYHGVDPKWPDCNLCLSRFGATISEGVVGLLFTT